MQYSIFFLCLYSVFIMWYYNSLQLESYFFDRFGHHLVALTELMNCWHGNMVTSLKAISSSWGAGVGHLVHFNRRVGVSLLDSSCTSVFLWFSCSPLFSLLFFLSSLPIVFAFQNEPHEHFPIWQHYHCPCFPKLLQITVFRFDQAQKHFGLRMPLWTKIHNISVFHNFTIINHLFTKQMNSLRHVKTNECSFN